MINKNLIWNSKILTILFFIKLKNYQKLVKIKFVYISFLFYNIYGDVV